MANRKIINEYIPDNVSHPGETLKDVLEEQSMSQAELSERSGRPKKTINEIINGKSSITPETALQFELIFGIPASFWNNRQKQYDEYLAKAVEYERLSKQQSWIQAFPIKEMITKGWLTHTKDPVEQVNLLLKYFGVASSEEWHTIWEKPEVAFRQSPAFNKNPESTSAWLRQGEIKAKQIYCKPFNKVLFSENLKIIRGLTSQNPDIFESKVIDLCAEAGVAVTFIQPLKGVPVFGVTRWLSPNKALIQLSLRGKYEDIFWFSFFHEAAHILLHGKTKIFLEANHAKTEDELEADKFARDLLIPSEIWQSFVKPIRQYSKKEVKEFAETIGISPAIVVGRMHHEKYMPTSYMNDLRKRFEFVENL